MNTSRSSWETVRWRTVLFIAGASLIILLLDTTGHLALITGYLRTPFHLVQSWITGRSSAIVDTLEAPLNAHLLEEENERLKRQVDDLERRNEELLEYYAEYVLLSSLVEYARDEPDIRRVAADVIGWEINNYRHYVTINKGERHGFELGMPVETDRGLVGRIVSLSPVSSQVQLLTDSSSAVNARLGASRATGVLEGQLSANLRMKWIAQDAGISENEVVMTSGLGGNFPPDLIIGRVTRVEQSASELFQEVEVRSAVDM
ncbi:MAG: rod shape-determining protein MreC, partial [Chloroflexota bacterium]